MKTKLRNLMVVGLMGLMGAVASAQTIKPITWDVVGLDSNRPAVPDGPSVFPVGARVCAGGAPLTGYTTRFAWGNPGSSTAAISPDSPYIRRSTSLPDISLPTIPAGACQDVFYDITVDRNALSYNTRAPYQILLRNSGGDTGVATPAGREIYVEYLISQNRNKIVGISLDGAPLTLGSPTSVPVTAGRTYSIRLDGQTATQGYEQFEQFLTLSSDIFRINSVVSTYTAAAGTDVDATTKVYANGCNWDNATRACVGVGKYGGVTSLTYNVTVIGAPGASNKAQALLYDFSGSSYHYNSDFGTAFVNFEVAAEQADLAITKTDGVTSVTSPGSTTYTIVVTNNGPGQVADAVVSDAEPPNVTFGSWTCAVTSPGTGGTVTTACGTASGSGSINTTVTMKPGAVITYTVPVTIGAGASGTIVNTAQVDLPVGVTDPTLGNNIATDTNIVGAASPADISITKSIVGSNFVLTIKNENGGVVTGGDIVIEDVLPAGYTSNFTGASDPQTCGATALTGAGVRYTQAEATLGTVTWTDFVAKCPALSGTVGAFATVYLPFTGSGLLSNTATVTSPADPNTANNSSTVGAAADLSIAKSVTPASVNPGGSVTYTLTVSNLGPGEVTSARVVDSAPSGVSFSAWTCAVTTAGTAGTVTTACGSSSGAGNIDTTVTMQNGAVVTYTVTANVSLTAAAGTINNVAEVIAPAGTPDPNTADNSSTSPLTVNTVPFADLSIRKSVNRSAPSVGDSVTFTVTVTNNGPSDVTGATVTDTLPVGFGAPTSVACAVTFGTAACGSATPSFVGTGPRTMTDTVDISSGGQLTYTITVPVTGSGVTGSNDWLNTATVTPPSGTVDPTPGNNTASASAEPSFLSVSKEAGRTSYNIGDTGVFVIRVFKTGNSAALGTITVTDEPPPGMTITSMGGVGWTCPAAAPGAGQPRTCTRDEASAFLGQYSPITVEVSFSASSAPSTTNLVFVTSQATRGDIARNYAEASSPVAVQQVTPVQPIPTLSQWAMIIMAALLAMFGMRRMRYGT